MENINLDNFNLESEKTMFSDINEFTKNVKSQAKEMLNKASKIPSNIANSEVISKIMPSVKPSNTINNEFKSNVMPNTKNNSEVIYGNNDVISKSNVNSNTMTNSVTKENNVVMSMTKGNAVTLPTTKEDVFTKTNVNGNPVTKEDNMVIPMNKSNAVTLPAIKENMTMKSPVVNDFVMNNTTNMKSEINQSVNEVVTKPNVNMNSEVNYNSSNLNTNSNSNSNNNESAAKPATRYGCNPSPFPKHTPIGMAYVPMQTWQKIYPEAVALQRGTLFQELDLPFIGEEAVPNDRKR